MYDIVDQCAASLLLLAKEYQNQLIMRDLDCVGFFLTMFISPLIGLQKPAASILAELASSRECAEFIERFPNFHQFVQANFCNQYGQLKTIAEGSAVGSNATVSVLQHVTTLVQRLQEHKMIMQQQQQQQQQQQHMQQNRVVYQTQNEMYAMGQVGSAPLQQQQQQQMFYNNGAQQPQQTHFGMPNGQQQFF
jgi:hypothetical protein